MLYRDKCTAGFYEDYTDHCSFYIMKDYKSNQQQNLDHLNSFNLTLGRDLD